MPLIKRRLVAPATETSGVNCAHLCAQSEITLTLDQARFLTIIGAARSSGVSEDFDQFVRGIGRRNVCSNEKRAISLSGEFALKPAQAEPHANCLEDPYPLNRHGPVPLHLTGLALDPSRQHDRLLSGESHWSRGRRLGRSRIFDTGA